MPSIWAFLATFHHHGLALRSASLLLVDRRRTSVPEVECLTRALAAGERQSLGQTRLPWLRQSLGLFLNAAPSLFLPAPSFPCLFTEHAAVLLCPAADTRTRGEQAPASRPPGGGGK